ncbi:hypothetical protein HL658_07775 [Azospirillum sp. RWY-5-1]|uniref:Peptidase C14 caspase domain-containing protein n=1 Tax=Azospirillum oleiclasticum TaxID=2735135 RepID=A0ABX2T5K7_9PROT|nr:caspase family protein [Azospirillum oleiclasticum]NYZ12445.1 hypothetical protein [Azospirillum oleiclasticum]NYZ19605.1 hypothetical protein [Azospirillum oleiclasticum]
MVGRVILMLAVLLLAGCVDPAGVARRPGAGGTGAAASEVYRSLRVETGTHTDGITVLAADADGSLLLSGGADKTARLWSLVDGAERGVLRPPIGDGDRGRIDAVALSPDGRLAAVAGIAAGPLADAALVFDTGNGRLVARITRPGSTDTAGGVERLAFTADGRRLGVRYRADGATRWYGVPDGQPAVEAGPLPPGSAPRALPLPGGRRVEGAPDGGLRMTNANGSAVWTVQPVAPPPSALTVSADGSVLRIVWPGGDRSFSVATMDDEPPTAPFAAAPPDPSLRTDGAALLRTAADGRPLWRTVLDSRVLAVAAAPAGGAAVAALGDGTLRWFGLEDGRERLALFLHSTTGAWIAWTPDGFFDHAEAAWNLAGWHVNRGHERAAEFVTIAQVYDVAYRPDLVRRAHLGAGRAASALAAGDADRPGEVLARGLPPTVTATVTPDADRRRATVTVEVQDGGGGIGRVLYRRNGVVVALDDAGTAAPLRLRRSVPLIDGPNQIEVVALDATNAVESAPVRGVVVDGRGGGRQGALHALVVGIDRYADERMRLAYAAGDARALAAALSERAAGLFTAVHVTPLLDEHADADAIAAAVRRMAEGMAETDTFLLFLAGHGVNLKGDYRFLSHDVRRPTLDEVARKGLSQDRMQELLAAVPADRAIVVLDTCYSGGVAEIVDRNLLMRTAHNRLARATGRGFLSAASDEQVAAEGYNGHGVLTAVLLEGLSGAAGREVTARALGDYARSRVPLIAERTFNLAQVPVFTLVGRDFTLARGRP